MKTRSQIMQSNSAMTWDLNCLYYVWIVEKAFIPQEYSAVVFPHYRNFPLDGATRIYPAEQRHYSTMLSVEMPACRS